MVELYWLACRPFFATCLDLPPLIAGLYLFNFACVVVILLYPNICENKNTDLDLMYNS